MSLKKMFKTAPLPFQGQKRRFAGGFATALSELKAKQDVKIVIDLFGGSGLLAHIAKHIIPEAKVIYNDYDNYSQRLMNIDKTNKLLDDIRMLLDGIPRDKQRIDEQWKAKILDRIAQDDKDGYVDYITLSASLLFSAKYALTLEEFSKENFYNRVKASAYDFDPDEYLAGLEIVKCDYLELFNQYKDVPGVLFVVDPPYLTTDTKTYLSDQYWKLSDFLNVINVLNQSNFVFFTSNKSSLIELCEWLNINHNINNPFENADLKTHETRLNPSSKYIDMMFTRILEMQKAS